ncbi:hypothetical protein OU415_09445 [Saccharopolyspora sp. WRP15-2]|uniref:Uncharacterized protein n=1 Tax=Saccharopolyspora oryzae TaxID=2997343 RepID=A0ABT4UX02_9PSEU|nr:hypothetical protein [Saccharopolyspora oryzae]MDA3625659.1 hypothetical protein [Saccharopolyspora oryzae]
MDFGAVSEKRKLVLATFDLCAVCALPFGEELRWQVSFDKDDLVRAKEALFGEAPVHEVCGLYASQVCPFVSSPHARLGDELRKGMKRPRKSYSRVTAEHTECLESNPACKPAPESCIFR